MPTQPRRAPSAARQAVPPETIPAWVPPVVYALLVLVLFREFVFGQANVMGQDTLALAYFARDFFVHYVRAHHAYPLWDPNIYGGLPFVAGMHGDVFYPPSLALVWMGTAAFWGWKLILHIFLAGIFAFAWLRELGVRRSVAFFGGLVYMLGAETVSLVYPGADAKIFMASLTPLAFWLLERAFARRRIGDFAFFGLGVTLMMFTSHMQIVYFAVWGISLYALFRAWQVWRADGGAVAARLFGLFALAGVLGVGASAIEFLPPLVYLQTYSQRVEKTLNAPGDQGYAYSTSWSLHPEEIVSLIVPDFVGDNAPTETASGATYWGRNPFKLNADYAGLVPLLLLPFVFLRKRRPRGWFFAALGALALLYALGATTPLFHLFYLIPGVKLFRAPSLIIFLYAFALTTLGALGLERFLDWASGTDEGDRKAGRRYVWIAAGVMVVLALLASSGALTSFWTGVVYRDISPDKLSALQSNLPAISTGFWLAAFLAILVAAVWEALASRTITPRMALVALAVLAALDLYRVDRHYIRATELLDATPETAAMFEPSDAVRFLQARQAQGEIFRAFDLSPLVGAAAQPNVLADHGIEQLAGHHPNYIGRYRDLLGGDMPVNMLSSNGRLLDLTNTTYLVSPGELKDFPYPVAFRGAQEVVYRNPNSLPRAFLVGGAQVVPDSDAVRALLSGTVDFRQVAALAAPLPAGIPQPEAGAMGQVEWKSRGVGEQELTVTTNRPALLVVTDNYYDAWHAEVDGRAAPLLRADYTFRAVPVPAGTHRVRFYFHASLLRTTAFVSAALILLLLVVGFVGTLPRRGRGAEA